ncbi:DNA (cytosine-5)-methyltransferase 3B [Araneus ventricosus]|uniref:DNA (Cytosine-5)-methyltransferase 3B n=1 Tax=Araneus ventricosus TaxID=182803 RepID=A0A4Y2PH51_ARAVE|nr:DNA (cytosine-5)-methyltransferase 3B [Araneus ventricosus]
MLRQRGKQAHWGNTWVNARGAVNWVGRVQRRSWPFLVSQMSLAFQNKTSLLDSARISNNSIPDLGYQQEMLLDHCLLKNLGRKATVEKIRTVTTQRNSLIQNNYTLLPVETNGGYDVLWVTELERIFGFPIHYTDTGNLNIQKRRELLGRSWSVPVIKDILQPLKSFFKTKDNLL